MVEVLQAKSQAASAAQRAEAMSNALKTLEVTCSIRQHTLAYFSIHQHTSAYPAIGHVEGAEDGKTARISQRMLTYADVS